MRIKRRTGLFMFILLVLLCLLSTSVSIHAKALYKWTDKDGHTHLSDHPPSEDVAIHVERIEYEEREGEELPSDDVKSFQDKLRELDEIVQSYKNKKSAQARYIKDVPVSRYARLTFTDIFGPEYYVLAEVIQLAGMPLLLIFSGIPLLFHLFFAFCLYRIVRKTGVSSAWLAWIPAINVFPMIRAAGKPLWWGALLLTPLTVIFVLFVGNVFFWIAYVILTLIDFVLITIVWISICSRLAVNKWLGLLILAPVAQLMLPAYLAFKRQREIDRSVQLKSMGEAEYDHFLGSTRITFGLGSTSTNLGPVTFKLDRFKKDKESPRVRLSIRLVHVPNFFIGTGTFGSLLINSVLDANGGDVYNRNHELKKKLGSILIFRENDRPPRSFDSFRDITLLKGTLEESIKSINGILTIRLPLHIQTIDFKASDRNREEYTSLSRVLLNNISGNKSSLIFRGPRENFLTAFAYDAKGYLLSVINETYTASGNNEHTIKLTFRRTVSSLKVFVASGFAKKTFTFQVNV